jgi:hypothetical protein
LPDLLPQERREEEERVRDTKENKERAKGMEKLP